MALIGSGSKILTTSPIRVVGLPTLTGTDWKASTPTAGGRAIMTGEGAWTGTGSGAAKDARPRGYLHPAAWVLPQVAGGLAAGRDRIVGEAELAGNLAGGRNAEASLSGSGTISSADLALIVSAVAALSGSSSLVADVTGKLEAAASLTGQASVTAALGALAGLVAALSGSTTVVGAITATGALASDVNASSELTAGQIADAVWDEVISGHLTSGTTGAALNGAGSAGDPWGTALPGAYGAGTAGKLLGDALADVDGETVHAVLAGIAAALLGEKVGNSYKSIDGSKTRITFTTDRASVTLDLT